MKPHEATASSVPKADRLSFAHDTAQIWYRPGATRGVTNPEGAGAQAEQLLSEHARTLLNEISRAAFGYFARMSDPVTCLVRDSSNPDSAATIAGSGFAFASYAVAADRGYIPREVAARHVLRSLRFLMSAPQNDGRDATGCRGFFYHFLDPGTGLRHRASELSTIDSGILFAGALAAAGYFDNSTADECELRTLADSLYRRADWQWALAPDGAIGHGWRPRRGFIPYSWRGYNEALFLYVLALGSPSFPIPADSYSHWLSHYRWKRIYGVEFVYSGPLFVHQLSHIWLDLRGVQDEYMRAHGIDYFENSRRATFVQREYARRNPRGLAGYSEWSWGVTSSGGPGPATRSQGGVTRRFRGYHARGVPFGPDDGTLSPWAVAASLPFAPELVIPTLQHLARHRPDVTDEFGLTCSYNPSFQPDDQTHGSDLAPTGWVAETHYAIDQGPVLLMLENFRSQLVWRALRGCEHIVRGLGRAGFTGGWLDPVTPKVPAADQPE